MDQRATLGDVTWHVGHAISDFKFLGERGTLAFVTWHVGVLFDQTHQHKWYNVARWIFNVPRWNIFYINQVRFQCKGSKFW